MKKEDITELLVKFYSNSCSKEEYEEVMIWLSDPKNEKEVDNLTEKHWRLLDGIFGNDQLDENRVLNNIKAEIREEKAPTKMRTIFKNSFNSAFLKVAAGVILCIGVYTIIKPSLPNKISEEYYVYNTNKGQRDTIFLEDGSKVVLNYLSQLRVSKNYRDKRNIKLSGEAFFDVRKNPDNPFKVEIEGMNVTALGTSFNISTFNSSSKVNLVTGKVKVDKEDSDLSLTLNPGEMARLDYKKGSLVKGKTNEIVDLGWTKNILVFSENNISEIAESLENRFNVEVEIFNENHKEWSYTGKFNDEGLNQILDLVSFSLGFEYEVIENNVKIY